MSLRRRSLPERGPSLAFFLQPVPTVQPFDSVGRAVRIMGETRMRVLPVVDMHGRLLGVVSSERIRVRLAHGDAETALRETLSGSIEAPTEVVGPDATVEQVQRMFASTGRDAAFVADRSGFLMGMVRWHDLVVPHSVVRAPLGAGGMATPFGVYLTAGGVRAGVGPGGLVVGGIALGAMIAAAHLVVGAGCWGADAFLGTSVLGLWMQTAPPREFGTASAWLSLQAASAVMFLVMLRLSPITGNHGAEHQVVHAMERGEPLTPEVVSRMPRVHARCGTNLIAAVAVFAGILQIVTTLRPFGLDALAGSLIGAAAAFKSWRAVGAFLQAHFTTKRPSPRQLERAIEAANDLRERYPREARSRQTVLKRLWYMGAPQTALGVFIGTGAPLVAFELLLR